MPEMLLLAVYTGVALDRLLEVAETKIVRRMVVVSIAGALGWGLFECTAIDANMLFDPRYGAEAWLAAHIRDDAPVTVETYGANAYLPRFPKGAQVSRIDVSALTSRNPLPNVVEVQAQFADIEERKPHYIVVTEAWVWRYFIKGAEPGRVVTPEQAERERDNASREYFWNLHTHQGGIHYRLVHESKFTSSLWSWREIHQSTAHDIRIFEREM